MDEVEFQRLVRVAFQEKARDIAQAEARFQKRMESIRQTRELSAIADAKRENEAVSLPYGEISLRVRRVLPSLPETFTLADVAKAIHQQDAFGAGADNKAISVALRRMIGDHLELLEKGQGKRGSRYRKLIEETPKMSLVG
jgi:hypothetical protein